MNLNLLLALLTVTTVATTYVFWVRPLLKSNPSFAHFFATEQSFTVATRLKLAGLKQKLTTAIIFMAGFIVTSYDTLAPLVAQTGVDVTSLTAAIPPKAWPVITLALLLLVDWFRKLAEKRQAVDPIELPQIPTVQAPPKV